MPHLIPTGDDRATIRFLNNTAARATLHADGAPVTGTVEAGSVTPYHPIDAESVALSLGPTGEGPVVIRRLESGGRYTVTARAAPQCEPTLRITREAEPAAVLSGR